MGTKMYWREVVDRAVRTAAQSAALVFGADQVNALNANWADVAGFAAGGAVLSVLSSLALGGVTGEAAE